MKTGPKIIFLGNESLSSAQDYHRTPILQKLISKQSVVAVITKTRPTKSRQIRIEPVIKLARLHKIPTAKVVNLADLKKEVVKHTPAWGIVASFGFLIPQDIRSLFQGMINIHPSLLPIYRGTTPIETALLNNDRFTGVSLHEINQIIDGGNLYCQSQIEIKPKETKLGLTIKLGQLASHLLEENLVKIFLSQLNPQPQDQQKAIWTVKIPSQETFLDLTQMTANQVQRHLIAFLNCPNNKIKIGQYVVEITQSQVSKSGNPNKEIDYDRQNRRLILKCRHNYLHVKRLKPANRNQMTAADFFNGYLSKNHNLRDLVSR